MRFYKYIAVAALCATMACGEQQRSAVPRREALPRVEQREARYQAVDGVPVAFDVNVAECGEPVLEQRDGATWLTVAYPRFDAKLYVTFTPVSPQTIDQVVDNRLERMSLNFGNAAVDADQFVSAGGYVCTLATSRSTVSTPVQFIALPPDGSGTLVSGALFVNGDPTDIVEIATADLLHSLGRVTSNG